MTIAASRNPLEWTAGQLGLLSDGTAPPRPDRRADMPVATGPLPAVAHITPADLRAALRDGTRDFLECRTDVVFLCIMYPIAGLVLGTLTVGRHVMELAFPLLAGFTLVGPVLATGLYEMSRRREDGYSSGWSDAFRAFRSPAIGSIVGLGLVLLAIFIAWIEVAERIYMATLGPNDPLSISSFINTVLNTGPGHTMLIVGIAVGAVFAAIVLAISVVSFPLLLDRDPGVIPAVRKSLEAVARNPITLGLWGLIVATLLALGALPALIGLAVVMPILGHATWHLYRRLVPR